MGCHAVLLCGWGGEPAPAPLIFHRMVERTIFNHSVERNPLATLVEPMLNQVYGAIADPTRRAILGILAEGEINVGGLAERFPISLNGVSKHVKVLERAGLVERTVQGREHRLRLNAEPLLDASMWLEHYREFWGTRLGALEAFLLQKEQKRGAGSEPTQHPRQAQHRRRMGDDRDR
jgi:DNA-binding transcriptional ArsR family regulator